MTGVSGVLSRISELQLQLGLTPPAATTNGGTAFAAALRDATSATGVATTAGPGASSGPTGADVVAAAKKYLGTPYVFGGTDPAKGLDCSALVQRAYADLGVDLPRNSWQQAKAGTAVHGLANARPGDILAFDSPVDHVAIYLGGNKMIAAPKPGDHVKIQSVYEKPTHIRRVVGAEAAPAGSAPTAVRPAGLQDSGKLAGVPYADMFIAAGRRHGVAPTLLAAVAKVESGYDRTAVSKAGAQGLMQLMPATARELGVRDSFDPAQAIEGAAKLLSRHLDEFGSVPLALAAYNAGAGAVHRHGGIRPYAETRAYVPKVQKAWTALGG
ncbi:transglycosylase SLT domain-containing protein [Mangrovihabitans endophyticus]|nr:transglycosylase SLT domain-containing protein [Mangrovihabitans endophyticus]